MDIQKVFEDLQSLNVEDLARIGSVPLGIRLTIIGLAMLTLAGLSAWFFVLPRFDQLSLAEKRETQLRKTFSDEQKKVANLNAYRAQLDEMARSFSVMLRQLPDKVDIESLLVDLSQTGVTAGLRVESFKPEGEVHEEFYAKYPIELSVSGSYHKFGNFVSGLAALPRIVTLHDIVIMPAKDASGRLRMNLTATTYRYLEEGDS